MGILDLAPMKTPWLILSVLLALQAVLVALHPAGPLGGDEPYYVEKARYFAEHRTFPRISEDSLAAERGQGGNSDWRPQGYPLFVAAVSGGNFDPAMLRRRVSVAQFTAMAAATLAAMAALRGTSARRQILAAVVLGIAPWQYEFVALIGPDSLNASIAFFALLLLARWAAADRSSWPFLAGSLLLSVTHLLRPEMIAVTPLPIAVAVLIRCRTWRSFLRYGALGTIVFLTVVAAQYAYRTHFVGRPTLSLFGGLHIYNAGAFEWVHTWLGTEHEGYDFVYGLPHGASDPLPARAFESETEQRLVEALRSTARREGYSNEIDRAFGELARRRRTASPIRSVVLPRLWRAVHLWVNLETNDQLLSVLRPLPGALRRPVLGFFLLMKIALLACFAAMSIRLAHAPWRWNALPTVFVSFVIARTVLVGIVLGWMAHRYAVACWLPLIVVACSTAGGALSVSTRRDPMPASAGLA